MGLKIGELALAAGVSPHTIRYYEKLRLIPRADRTYAGYRRYTAEDVKRVRFIKQAQAIGFSLAEIKQVLLGAGGPEGCQRIRNLLSSKLKQIDSWLAEMQGFREAVAGYLGKCEEALRDEPRDGCPVLSELAQATNVWEEPEVIRVLDSGKSNAKARQEKVWGGEQGGETPGRHESASLCCEYLLHGAGLVRPQAA